VATPGTTVLFVATRATRSRRRVHQALRVVAIAVFLSFAEVTFMLAFPPVVRLAFSGAIAGTAVVLSDMDGRELTKYQMPVANPIRRCVGSLPCCCARWSMRSLRRLPTR